MRILTFLVEVFELRFKVGITAGITMGSGARALRVGRRKDDIAARVESCMSRAVEGVCCPSHAGCIKSRPQSLTGGS
jgi:hypothetical protein